MFIADLDFADFFDGFGIFVVLHLFTLNVNSFYLFSSYVWKIFFTIHFT